MVHQLIFLGNRGSWLSSRFGSFILLLLFLLLQLGFRFFSFFNRKSQNNDLFWWIDDAFFFLLLKRFGAVFFNLFVKLVDQEKLAALIGVIFGEFMIAVACEENLLNVYSMPDAFLVVEIVAPVVAREMVVLFVGKVLED